MSMKIQGGAPVEAAASSGACTQVLKGAFDLVHRHGFEPMLSPKGDYAVADKLVELGVAKWAGESGCLEVQRPFRAVEAEGVAHLAEAANGTLPFVRAMMQAGVIRHGPGMTYALQTPPAKTPDATFERSDRARHLGNLEMYVAPAPSNTNRRPVGPGLKLPGES